MLLNEVLFKDVWNEIVTQMKFCVPKKEKDEVTFETMKVWEKIVMAVNDLVLF